MSRAIDHKRRNLGIDDFALVAAKDTQLSDSDLNSLLSLYPSLSASSAVVALERKRDSRYIGAMDRDARKRRLERFSRNERIFPGGDHPTGNCGACARIITDRFGGKVVGYYHADNRTARVGETEFGHDFAITEDRFLVDPWLYHYYGDSPVLDLTEAAGQEEAAARYGPEENWKPLPSREALVKVSRARSTGQYR